MIKIFRHIRQRYISEGKTKKYLLYAIGEIVLVVIGILIALSINNWNEDRRASKEELHMLKAIEIGLEADFTDLKWNEKRIISSIASADVVIHSLENNLPYNDSIPDYIGDMMFPVIFEHSTSAFETLKSKSINLIKNETLRDEIIRVYGSEYSYFLRNESSIILDENERAIRDLFSTRFEESYVYDLNASNSKPRLKPLNYEVLKTDQEFLYFVKSYRNRLNLFLNYHYRQKLLKLVKTLIMSIDTEIKNIEA
ncbi:DUF6090 family protein [Lacinutrix jangbogonensis]|uniref:DUF6090 family protein n=1 Tax=Lacinutrix jangbogonensis TaxID=1469557 RepID=UPI00068C0750|nr:DUF6090 family protein [Lacinutrix jangbogonensis]